MSSTRFILNLPKINNIDDLAFHLSIDQYLLKKLVYTITHYYREVNVPKSNGQRVLACPSKSIKVIQAWILREILERFTIHHNATAFIKGKGIKDNVSIHTQYRFHVCLDVKNFFGTIPYKWVYNFFYSIGYSKHVAHLLSTLCTYKEALPQGGVTSPMLSNLLCAKLDRRITGYTSIRNIAYTRYADDITISGNNPEYLLKAIKFVRKIINDEGFTINEDKFRIIRPHNRCKITGLVISDENYIGIGSAKKRELRAKIYWLNRANLEEEEKEALKNHLLGWMAYLKYVDPVRHKCLEEYWHRLTAIY